MTNTRLDLAIGIPLIFNMGTLFLLFQALNGRLDGKVDGTRLELTSRIDRVADATATFYRELDKQETILGRHDAAIEKLLGK